MLEDVRGTWTGTDHSDGIGRVQGLDPEGWLLGRGEENFDVTLAITSQGRYRNFGGGRWISAVSGEFLSEGGDATAISGFVDLDGRVRLSLYSADPSYNWNFNGKLRLYVMTRRISGNWIQTWLGDEILMHQLGTLDVKQRRSLVYRGSFSPYRYRGEP